LYIHQPRQNPMVSGRDWLAVPPAVEVVRADSSQPRTLTPRYRDLHTSTFVRARGWTDVNPYFEIRDVLQPNTGGGFWNTPSADCYVGIAASWYVDVWGDHNREAFVSRMSALDFDARTLRVHPALARVLRAYGVSHLLSLFPQQERTFALVSHAGNAYVYRVDGAARARFVRAAGRVRTNDDAVRRLLDSSFDPDREILLHDAPGSLHPSVEEVSGAVSSGVASRAIVTREDSRQVVIEAEAPEDGFLLLADTYYPGWTAQVDGAPTPLYRANVSVRGIGLPKGRHQVRFTFDPPGFWRGLQITLLSVSMLLLWAGGAALADRRVPRPRHGPAA
jgi:hypothetical protein